MTPRQPSLLDAVARPQRTRRTASSPVIGVHVPRARKSTRRAKRCQCRSFLLPYDLAALDGKRYCRSCWAELPAWMKGTVPMAEWPEGWKRMTGMER